MVERIVLAVCLTINLFISNNFIRIYIYMAGVLICTIYSFYKRKYKYAFVYGACVIGALILSIYLNMMK